MSSNENENELHEGWCFINMDAPACMFCGAHPGESHLMRHCALAIARLV